MTDDIRSISETLDDLRSRLTEARVSVDLLLDGLHERGFGFVILIFALPMAIPLPVPIGVNVVLALPLILLTIQQAIGRRTIWLPVRMRAKMVSSKSVAQFLNKAIPFMQKVEVLLQPRLGFVTRGVFSHLIGVAGLVMALVACIPLPLTNTVPSLGIALMAVGVLSRDGLAVLAGAAIGGLWVLFLGWLALFFGPEGFDMAKDMIKSWL